MSPGRDAIGKRTISNLAQPESADYFAVTLKRIAAGHEAGTQDKSVVKGQFPTLQTPSLERLFKK